MTEWFRSIEPDQWLRLVEIYVFAIVVGVLRRKGCEANMRDEMERRNAER